MRRVAVEWQPDERRFVVSGSHVGHSIEVNAPAAPGEVAGGVTGFSATELLLAGAGACAAWDVVEIVRKQRLDVTGLSVETIGEQSTEPPWAYERLRLVFRFRGRGLSVATLRRGVELSVDRYCSVLATVRGVARIEAVIEIDDPDGASGPSGPATVLIRDPHPVRTRG